MVICSWPVSVTLVTVKVSPRDGLPRFHRRDGCPTEQPHRRVPFGKRRVAARGGEGRLVIDRVHIDRGDGHRRARVIAPIGRAPAINNLVNVTTRLASVGS